MVRFFRYSFMALTTLVLMACEQANGSFLNSLTSASIATVNADESNGELKSVLELGAMIEGSRSSVNVDAGFERALLQALDQDPAVLAAKSEATVTRASLQVTETGFDTQVKATLLGGVEDVTDETAGVAAILTANRLLYDGGMLDAKVDADASLVKAADQAYVTMRGKRALNLAIAWIELERYQSLERLINSRLEVLDPLLVQLERVASSGAGDVSQVASAKRIVSSILVAKTSVSEKYQQAKISFVNGFGRLPSSARYEASWVSSRLPASSSARKLAENSPGLAAQYWAYRAAEASVLAIKAKDNFSISLNAKLQQPFGGSEADSAESVGLVFTKEFYQGNQLTSQVERAEAVAHSKAAKVFSTYRESELAILAAREMVKSMEKAITLVRNNANSSREETEYLRKQLIIGGSTLESVLSAEARLYDAESKEIDFTAERLKAQATIIAITGDFSEGLSPD
ncbi:TolC family protein [Planktomarina sp.]|nr:TolC family protein [Planktomarina sp.]